MGTLFTNYAVTRNLGRPAYRAEELELKGNGLAATITTATGMVVMRTMSQRHPLQRRSTSSKRGRFLTGHRWKEYIGSLRATTSSLGPDP